MRQFRRSRRRALDGGGRLSRGGRYAPELADWLGMVLLAIRRGAAAMGAAADWRRRAVHERSAAAHRRGADRTAGAGGAADAAAATVLAPRRRLPPRLLAPLFALATAITARRPGTAWLARARAGDLLRQRHRGRRRQDDPGARPGCPAASRDGTVRALSLLRGYGGARARAASGRRPATRAGHGRRRGAAAGGRRADAGPAPTVPPARAPPCRRAPSALLLDDGLQNPTLAQGSVAAGGRRRDSASATAGCFPPARCASRSWPPRRALSGGGADRPRSPPAPPPCCRLAPGAARAICVPGPEVRRARRPPRSSPSPELAGRRSSSRRSPKPASGWSPRRASPIITATEPPRSSACSPAPRVRTRCW